MSLESIIGHGRNFFLFAMEGVYLSRLLNITRSVGAHSIGLSSRVFRTKRASSQVADLNVLPRL